MMKFISPAAHEHEHRVRIGRCSTFTTLLVGSLLATTAQSQSTTSPTPPNYDIGNALQQVRPQPVQPPQAPQVPSMEVLEPPLSLPGGQTLTVQAFRFEGLEGADRVSEAELQAVVAADRGRALTMADIEALASRVSAVLRAHGYLLARAYVPRQDARQGTLTLRVLIGRVAQVQITNHSRVADPELNAFFEPLGNDWVSRTPLERTMLLVGELPGASMPRLTVAPGEAPGTSDLQVDVGSGPWASGYLLADNLGSRYTGRHRVTAHVDVLSPLGIGDRLAAHAMSSQGGGLINGRLGYSLALGGSGLRGELAFAKTTYELGSTYADLDATGSARSVEVSVTYPWIRQRNQSLNLNVGFVSRELNDHIGADDSFLPKTSQSGNVALSWDRWGMSGAPFAHLQVVGNLTAGHLSINDSSQATQNRAGANTIGDWAHLNLGAFVDTPLGKSWGLMVNATLQQTLGNRNLDTSEQMTVSGPSAVKVYRETISGDDGYALGAELRYALPTWAGWKHSVSTFADTARVRYENGDYVTTNGTRVSDWGLGYSARLQGALLRMQWAHAIGDLPPSTADGRDRILVQLGWLF